MEGGTMLVLTRRAGESVMIGDDVVITVLEARGDVIRLGIQAPRDVQVHREEVYKELQAANREAASPTEDAVRAVTEMLNHKDD
jgi:carbon storage regulator